MESNLDNHCQKVAVNANEIIAKYRRLEDRINFCLEKNWYHPKETGYDANFFFWLLREISDIYQIILLLTIA